MQGLGDLVRRCCFLAVFGGISACSSFEVGPFLKEQITGDSWRACLAREYQRQAKIHVRTDRNWGEATRLAERGQAALDGVEVPPPPGAPAALSRRTCPCATALARLDAAVPTFAEALEACEKSPPP